MQVIRNYEWCIPSSKFDAEILSKINEITVLYQKYKDAAEF